MADVTIGALPSATELAAGDLIELEQGESPDNTSAKATLAQLVDFVAAEMPPPEAGSRAPAIQSVTSAATVTPTFANDLVIITAQAAALTLANPTGTAIPGLGMVVRIKDNGAARTISYGTQYRAVGVTLPTTTVAGKTTYLAMIYNATDGTWDVIAVGTQA